MLRTIGCRYNAQDTLYTFKTNDDSIEELDFVVVHTSGTYSVVRVVEIHDEPQLDGRFMYKWIVQKVDPTQYNILVKIANAKNPTTESRL